MSRKVCTVPYHAPNGREVYLVDPALVHVVLDRLNRLPGVKVYSVCSGHATGVGDRQASLVLSSPRLQSLAPYLERLSATDYTALVERYRGNGEPEAWHLEVRRPSRGQAPDPWWYRLVDTLEDNPDCTRWMAR